MSMFLVKFKEELSYEEFIYTTDATAAAVEFLKGLKSGKYTVSEGKVIVFNVKESQISHTEFPGVLKGNKISNTKPCASWEDQND